MPDGIDENSVKCVTVIDDAEQVLVAATNRAVYRLDGREGNFYQVLAFPTGQTEVYAIYASGQWVAVATSEGVWGSDDQGRHWEHVFRSVNELHRICFSVFILGDEIFIGTADGVFRRTGSGEEWLRHRGALSSEPVYAITGDSRYVFFSAGDGIYREEIAGSAAAEKIFTITSVDDMEEDNAVLDDEADSDGYAMRTIRSIAYDAQSEVLFAVTRDGFFAGDNNGSEWKEILRNGLSLAECEKIIVYRYCPTSHGQRALDIQNRTTRFEPEPALFLALRSGAFLFFNSQWYEMYAGLTARHIYDIAADRQGHVFTASDAGMFFLQEQPAVLVPDAWVHDVWMHEPSVQDVHQMVTAYADVGKDKIDQWKKLSRMKAILPSVSWQAQRDVADIYHWDSGASPDILQQGVDALDWSIALKWELADVVWSTAQTTIDTRAKMMVELREDLLAQATRIYFERRRMQIELMHMPDDAPEKWQMQIRVDELTAGLDAMTGGRFSQGCDDRPAS